MKKRGQIPSKPDNFLTPVSLMFFLVVSIFTVESLSMFVISLMPPLSTLPEALLDSAILTLLVSPLIYLFVFRPLVRQYADRKRAEEQAAIFRQFVDASGQGVGMGTLDGKITYANPSLCRLLGEDKPEDVIGKAFVPYYPEELQQRMQNEIIPAVMERGQWVGELAIKSTDGSLTPTLENIFLIRDEKGNPICLADIMTDITDLKKAEEQTAIFREFADASGQGFGMATLEGKITYVNHSLCDLLGEDNPDKVFGKAIVSYYPEELQQRFQNEIIPAVLKRGQWTGELTIKSIDGKLIPTLENIFLIRDEKGNPICLACIMTDITKLKRAEEQAVIFRQFAEASGQGFAMATLDGKATYLNPALCRMLGIDKPEDLIGKTFNPYRPEDLQQRVQNEILPSVMERGQWVGELAIKSTDGRLTPTLENIFLIRDTGGNPLCLANLKTDISERKRAEGALQRRTYDLGERIKELNCLYTTKSLMAEQDKTKDDVFQGITDLIPPSWQYPPITCARITVNGGQYTTENFIETEWRQNAGIRIFEEIAGSIDVFYMEEKPTIHEGPFLKEERDLIDALAREIGRFFEQRQAEEALSASEHKYKTLLENIPQKIFSKDKDSVYVSCNENYANDLKIKPEEITGKTDDDFFPKELAEKYRADDRKIMEHGEIEELDERYIEDDKEFTVHTIKTPIRDENGDITGILGLFWDITEQKRAEEALRESEERYRGLVENIDIGISMIGPQMEILSLNRKMREWFTNIDPSKKAICDESYNDSPDNEVFSYSLAAKTLKDGKVHEEITESRTADEIKSYRAVSFPINDNQGNVVAAIEMVEDITEKLKIEEEHARTDKLESIGTLAGGIAHDFNNLLAGFMGNISMAKMDIAPETKAYNALERAETASVRAKRLTLQLLTFAKGGAPVKELTSVPELIEDTVGFALSGSNIKCDFQIPDDIWEVTVDKAQIGQAIRNLVQNAAQAMTDGGSIMISVENLLAESGGPVPLDEGKYIKISVKDEGSGIAEKHLQKIFEPYFTTREDGSGLGLPAVYSIVKNHAGHVDVDSEVGVGTTFSVYLPATEKEVSPEPAAEEKIISGKGRVLVMDDEEMIRTMLEEMLEIIGYEVECTSDGAEAIELFKREKDSDQPFDVLIIDLTIPGGMGGKEAMARIREIDSEIKSIVSSGYSSDKVVANFREYGFTACLNKPYNTSQLSSVLDEVLTS